MVHQWESISDAVCDPVEHDQQSGEDIPSQRSIASWLCTAAGWAPPVIPCGFQLEKLFAPATIERPVTTRASTCWPPGILRKWSWCHVWPQDELLVPRRLSATKGVHFFLWRGPKTINQQMYSSRISVNKQPTAGAFQPYNIFNALWAMIHNGRRTAVRTKAMSWLLATSWLHFHSVALSEFWGLEDTKEQLSRGDISWLRSLRRFCTVHWG